METAEEDEDVLVRVGKGEDWNHLVETKQSQEGQATCRTEQEKRLGLGEEDNERVE